MVPLAGICGATTCGPSSHANLDVGWFPHMRRLPLQPRLAVPVQRRVVYQAHGAHERSVKYMYLDRYFLAMAYLPVFIIMLSDILPELWCIVSVFGFILDAAFKDIMEHMEDVEERIHEEANKKALNHD
ncbi:hypothetical protein Ae201684P_016121 [Aphanomyces euteiches]|uniref:Uncharacterized protein n=1 Tax=Aphanomyces euteiches TaxID=100861 RepID=A0A6G0WF10_9STRA|nr:hypothetical protein Ae201684_015697 [Aphanomyces euteiches]KAH9093493.1 hypothetical protein Ae201684P_016121 [Aphanomyces euteiches]KAH9134780.1 hypothetical protein AeRB84_019549 [Aphanomyces euteiches]